jgi:hypothetical protein
MRAVDFDEGGARDRSAIVYCVFGVALLQEPVPYHPQILGLSQGMQQVPRPRRPLARNVRRPKGAAP